MPEPLNQSDLDAAACQVPGCTHQDHGPLHLKSRCHTAAGTRCRYARGTGVLEVRCAECEALIAEVAVSPLGATGEPAEAAAAAADGLGGLNGLVAANREANRVMLEFGKSVRWVSMTRREALEFADQLRRKADRIGDAP